MYKIVKEMKFKGRHFIPEHDECGNEHSHTWIIKVFCKSNELDDKWNMVTDFKLIKKKIEEKFYNFEEPLNKRLKKPTAENIAYYICSLIPKCYKVQVWESANNFAEFALSPESIGKYLKVESCSTCPVSQIRGNDSAPHPYCKMRLYMDISKDVVNNTINGRCPLDNLYL